jgi:hypothetical protein
MQDAVYYSLVACSSYMPLDPRPPVKPSRDLPN